MGVHESQSLLWERMVALSLPFAKYLTPLLKASFPQLPKDLTPEQVRVLLQSSSRRHTLLKPFNRKSTPVHCTIESLLDSLELPILWPGPVWNLQESADIPQGPSLTSIKDPVSGTLSHLLSPQQGYHPSLRGISEGKDQEGSAFQVVDRVCGDRCMLL